MVLPNLDRPIFTSLCTIKYGTHQPRRVIRSRRILPHIHSTVSSARSAHTRTRQWCPLPPCQEGSRWHKSVSAVVHWKALTRPAVKEKLPTLKISGEYY
ncbi:hypothetical protein BV22DRAFT_1035968 [Leucogyrophana mollusca]|uniref:Uncharacterized protein n=1 Tax=Leucogyrophana mollusca TaxID=85980 RepID=A0ACB8BF23_9AGAM|nr:hypothetical protein BV22DRAFT_1035968 [Leucogyrophana mollusca]